MSDSHKLRPLHGRRSLATIICVAVLGCLAIAALASASPADAANRWAAPSGKGAWPCTNKKKPCPIRVATNPVTLQDGDSVLLGGGTYRTGADVFVIGKRVTLRPAPGAGRPRIVIGSGTGLYITASQVRVQDITIESGATSGVVVNIQANDVIIDRVIVLAKGDSSHGILVSRDAIVRNSLVYSTGDYSTALNGSVNGGWVRNVTAIATGEAGVAASANTCWAAPGEVVDLDIYNSYLRGVTHDLAVASPCSGRTASVEIAFSAYRLDKLFVDVDEVTFSTPAPNLSGVPSNLYLSKNPPDKGLFQQRKGSPTINFGTSHPAWLGTAGVGSKDLIGNKRVVGIGPDVGATELETKKPKLKVKTKRSGGSIKVTASCNELCSIRVSGGVKAGKADLLAKNLKFSKKLKVKQPGARPTTVKVTATDLSGNKSTKTVKVQ